MVSSSQSKVIIHFAPYKLLKMFIPLGIFMLLSLYLHFDDWMNLSLRDSIIFLAVGLFLVFSVQVFPEKHYLLLSSKGLTIYYFKTQRHYSWDEIFNFRLEKGGKIVFNLTPDSSHRKTSKKVMGRMLGYDVSLLNWFDKDATEIVDLLYKWQKRYCTVNPS